MEQNKKTESFTKLPTPDKSANDRKEYRVFKLQNGLTVCLMSDVDHLINLSTEMIESFCSDDESGDESSGSLSGSSDEYIYNGFKKQCVDNEEKLAAACLCVGVGSFSDPQTIPGMAHFLEHMVFMGSEKFPTENDFDSFIKKSGGSDNAVTDADTTMFYFECHDKYLFNALDKFSQFFISPLLRCEAMSREREAIESEFQMALQEDSSRREQLLFSLADINHPANHFSYGNLISLRDNISDDILYEELHKFRKHHYSAHRMTLAIQARLTLGELEKYVVDCFSAVPNNQLPLNDILEVSNNAFDTPNFKQLYFVKSINDICEVHLTWSLPSLLNLYKSKPDEYVANLLGYEGKGSIISYLRKQKWALNITAGVDGTGSEHNAMFSLFSIKIELTEIGLQHLTNVLEAVFSYIHILQKEGPQENIFKELQVIEDTSFCFKSESTAIDHVCDVAEAMQYYPSKHYLTGTDLYLEYKPEEIKKICEYLTPVSVNIMVLTKKTPQDIVYDKIEKWFKTEYTNKDIPLEWITKWKNAELSNIFYLPEQNIYISKNFEILNHDHISKYPVKILNTSLMEVWYRADVKFKLPIVYMYYNFITPLSISSPENAVMFDLFVLILKQQLSEETYPAVKANLDFSIDVNDTGLTLKLKGYNEKLPLLLFLIVKYIHSFSDNLTIDLFSIMKEKLKQYYYNNFLDPEELSQDIHLAIVTQVHWTSIDKYNSTSEINFENMKCFGKCLLKHLYIQCLIQGNILKQESVNICKSVIDILQCGPLFPNTFPQIRVSQIPEGQYCCSVQNFNKDDENSVVTNYYQSGLLTVKNVVLVELIMMIIKEPLFDILRTKEQLGYCVDCTARDTFGILGFSISVNFQISKFSPNFVNNRIENFIRLSIDTLRSMSSTEFCELKENFIKLKQCMDLNLKSEVSRNWVEITEQRYNFDRIQQQIECIEEIRHAELYEWFSKHSLYGSKENLRKVSLQVVGCKFYDNTFMETNESKKISTENESSSQNFHGICHYGDAAEFSLQFVPTSDKTLSETSKRVLGVNSLITNIEVFKNSLFIYPLNRCEVFC